MGQPCTLPRGSSGRQEELEADLVTDEELEVDLVPDEELDIDLEVDDEELAVGLDEDESSSCAPLPGAPDVVT